MASRVSKTRALSPVVGGVKRNAEIAATSPQSREELNEFKKSRTSSSSTEISSCPLPTRAKSGQLIFLDHPNFRPNLTPKEILQAGAFGGTYFRPIHSSVTHQQYGEEVWRELPPDWFEGLDVATQVASPNYRTDVNKYKAKCGQGLKEWESSGWITSFDPYGWFQWYCRFYQGRRCADDIRQISRGNGVMGPTGRSRRALINKVVNDASSRPGGILKAENINAALKNMKISPVVRQLLLHWGYELTFEDVTSNLAK